VASNLGMGVSQDGGIGADDTKIAMEDANSK
jgi:hypothetical protein